MGRPGALAQRPFEGLHRRPLGQPVAAQDRGHRVDVGLIDVLTPVGQEGERGPGRRFGHHGASAISRISRAPSSQSPLVSLA